MTLCLLSRVIKSFIYWVNCYRRSLVLSEKKRQKHKNGRVVAFFNRVTAHLNNIFSSLQRIKDSQLVIIVIALLAILCSVLILWEIVDPLFIVSRKLESEVSLIIQSNLYIIKRTTAGKHSLN